MVRMDLFRSEEMNKVQFIIPTDSAHDTMTYLAELGHVQFKDLNKGKSPFQRAYASQAKRCEEMARKIRWFQNQLSKAKQTPVCRHTLDRDLELEELELRLTELETELLESIGNSDKLKRSYNEMMELGLVLHKASVFFMTARSIADLQRRQADFMIADPEETGHILLLEQMQEASTNSPNQSRLGFVAGVVVKTKCASFERILFRATRGNMYLKQSPWADVVADPASGNQVEKVVFILFFSSERARVKITKICEAFGVNRYPFPEDAARQRQMKVEVSARLSELQATLNAGIVHRQNVLANIGYNLDYWVSMVKREKAVYCALNMLSVDVTRKCLVAEGWCPVKTKPQIEDALKRATFDSKSQLNTIFQVMQTKESPPTFYETNKFTAAFQEIVDAYGVARNLETS